MRTNFPRYWFLSSQHSGWAFINKKTRSWLRSGHYPCLTGIYPPTDFNRLHLAVIRVPPNFAPIKSVPPL